jgi:hypothetical protein
MDDAQIRESIEEFVAEGNELWQARPVATPKRPVSDRPRWWGYER